LLGEAGGKIYVAVRGWREKIGCQARLEGKDKVARRDWRKRICYYARLEGTFGLLGEAGGI
jgi:hypothetical protein